jgi:transposase-like protein
MNQSNYTCEECGATFYTREDLENHDRTVHSRFRCDICGETLDSETELDAHNRIAHPEAQRSGRGSRDE